MPIPAFDTRVSPASSLLGRQQPWRERPLHTSISAVRPAGGRAARRIGASASPTHSSSARGHEEAGGMCGRSRWDAGGARSRFRARCFAQPKLPSCSQQRRVPRRPKPRSVYTVWIDAGSRGEKLWPIGSKGVNSPNKIWIKNQPKSKKSGFCEKPGSRFYEVMRDASTIVLYFMEP